MIGSAPSADEFATVSGHPAWLLGVCWAAAALCADSGWLDTAGGVGGATLLALPLPTTSAVKLALRQWCCC